MESTTSTPRPERYVSDNLAMDLLDVLEVAHQTTGDDYKHLVPLVLTLQEYDIQTLVQLQGVISRHDRHAQREAAASSGQGLWSEIKTWLMEIL